MRREKAGLEGQLAELQRANESLKGKFSALLEKFQDYIARVEDEKAADGLTRDELRDSAELLEKQKQAVAELEGVLAQTRGELAQAEGRLAEQS